MVGTKTFLFSAVTKHFCCPECRGRIVYRFMEGEWGFACPRCDKPLEELAGCGEVVGWVGGSIPVYAENPND